MMEELKPCPFCGHAGKIKNKQYVTDLGGHELTAEIYYGYCSNCGADGPGWFKTKADAAAAWNMRAKEDV